MTHQPTLFDEQAAQLARVRSRIAGAIVDFCAAHPGREFRMAELVEFVGARVPHTAPDSASRILRALRSEGAVRVGLVSRRGSLYRVEG